MKEFSSDLVSDRKFEIGGVVLEWRYPYWEELAVLFDQDNQAVRNGEGDITTRETMEQLIERVSLFLTPDSGDRWREVAYRRDDPLPAFQIAAVFRWLVEETSGRPTLPPSDSAPGGGNTGASSPDGSPSTEETPTA